MKICPSPAFKLTSPAVRTTFLLLLLSARCATAQTIPASSQSTDPKTMFHLLINENGLDFTPAAPWHIKLSYDQFDEDGDNIHSGVLEEYYASPKKYKASYAGDAFNQTDIATEAGLYRSGDPKWMSATQLQVQNEVLRPVYLPQAWEKSTKLDMIQWPVGDRTLPCVIARRTDMKSSDHDSLKFCFDRGTTRLRYTRERGLDQTLFNNLVLFQGRIVAKDVTVLKGGKSSIKIHVDTLESFAVAEDIFAPPADSALVAGRVQVQSGILFEYLLEKGDTLPTTRESGTVTVHFVVGKNGHVIEADGSGGSISLRDEALQTVHGYTFRPFLVLDQPVEVESSMNFEFQVHVRDR